MNNQNRSLEATQLEVSRSPEVLEWLDFIEKNSVFPPHNREVIARSAEKARELVCGLPFIITLSSLLHCPFPGPNNALFLSIVQAL